MKTLFSILLLLVNFSVLSQKLSTTFKPYVNGMPERVHIKEAADGNYFVYGGFEIFANIHANILKVDATAKPLTAFKKLVFDRSISNIIELSSGKILVGGSFHFVNGTSSSTFVRLNADGSVDNSFTSSFTAKVIDLLFSPPAKL